MSNVVVNGCFDIIHAGHVYLLEQAAGYGNVIVLINDDDYILKNKGRNITTYEQRKYILEAIRYVAKVDKFSSEEELYSKIKLWNPKYLVKGEDYRNRVITGQDLVEKIVFVPFRFNTSTSRIVDLSKRPK